MMFTAAVRNVSRYSTARTATSAARLASQPKPFRSPFRLPSTTTPLSRQFFGIPVEMSVCVKSLQPYHTATASALMTSMLTVSCCGYAWLPEGI